MRENLQPLTGATDVGLREVLPLKEERLVLRRCRCEAKAIAEIQTRFVSPLSKVAVRIARIVSLQAAKWLNLNIKHYQKVAEVRRPLLSQRRSGHNIAFNERRSSNPQGSGAFDCIPVDVGVRLVSEDGDDRGGIENH